MCGIFGILGFKARVDRTLLERGTQSLAHRGPDDSGTVLLSDNSHEQVDIGLGNRRLAILDLSPLGHQPMHDAGTGNWIVYNGEIYNFRDIRHELEQSGSVFLSHSDTEVVLKAYARWGEACFEKFRGMFAFALWDAKRRQLLIARDPMGIKPLYYAQAGDYFLFSSEVRSIFGTGLVRPRLDQAGLINYLTFGSAYDPLTPIEGIRALPAGHTLTWCDGSIRISPYWDLVAKDAGRDAEGAHGSEGVSSPADEKHATAKLQDILEESVRMQLVSDVPVGVFLSGGIDSSALVSILTRGGVKPSTFSIVFREAEFSEAEFSRTIARHFKTDHHEVSISQTDVLDAIPAALGAMDLPTMDGINTYFVSREARTAGVKVALSGLGGDEVFAGYSSFRTVPRAERFTNFWKHIPRPVRGSLAFAFNAVAPASDQNRKLAMLATPNGHTPHPYFITRMLFTPAQRALLLLGKDAGSEFASTASQLENLELSLQLDAVNRVSYLESRCYMLNTLLRDTDFMSMSQGLEVRVPLIDHHLAKAVLSLPGAWKLNRTPKKLLVDSLGLPLPAEVVKRRKRGFTLPFEHWMRQELRSEMESALSAKQVAGGPLSNFVNAESVQQVWQDFLGGAASWTRPWSLYVLQRWSELHL
ncbi:MAG TPA: asparagine synthase (glutamine-hydrolyzing) [Candidatus Solibacter sp.]|nr:asparagine synthase (glutamine-hydrolyzing) [Candidatus Solibacter sp.]